MSDLQFLKKVEQLDHAILKKDYAQIKKLLNDTETAVNIGLKGAPLPLKMMFQSSCPQIARLFLECPRVDWLAFKWDRNLLNLERDFGVQYEPAQNSVVCESLFDYFYYLDDEFIEDCPEEAEQIYERIIQALLAANVSERKELLLFKTLRSFRAFKIVFKYGANVNVVDKYGATLLHYAVDPKIVLFLLKNGAKLNEYSKLNMPFFLQDIEAIKRLFKADAALLLQIIRDCPSLFHFYRDRMFLEIDILMTEEIFRAELKKDGYYLNGYVFNQIFKKYPKLKQIFISDLLNHLPAYSGWYESEFYPKLSDDQFLYCFWKSLERGQTFSLSILTERKELIRPHLTKFLHKAVQNGLKYTAGAFCLIGASWTSLYEGKSLLFVSTPDMISHLLKVGVSPLLEHDGYRFFEKNSHIAASRFIDDTWLRGLLDVGFDIFSRNTKSGKSLLDYLNPEVDFISYMGRAELRIPARIISKRYFDFDKIRWEERFVPIDEEGNTALHYIQPIEGYPRVCELRKTVNKAGRCALENVFEKYQQFDLVAKLYGKELDEFIMNYNVRYGDGWIKKIGGYLLVNSIYENNCDLLEHLLALGISFNRFLGPWTTVLEEIENCPTDLFGSCFELAVEKGFPVSVRLFERLVAYRNCSAAVSAFLDRCDDLMPYIECYCKYTNYNFYPDFLQHEKVKEAILKNAENGISILDRCFFRIAKNKFFVEILQNYGADARKLIGTEVKLKQANVFRIEKSAWQALADSGWTLDDFKNLPVFDQYILESESFRLVFTTAKTTFKDIQTDLVYNSELICPICKETIEANDPIILVPCRHLFHRDCVEGYFEKYRECPYCRATFQ